VVVRSAKINKRMKFLWLTEPHGADLWVQASTSPQEAANQMAGFP